MCVCNYSYPTSGSDIKGTQYSVTCLHTFSSDLGFYAVLSLAGCLWHHFCILASVTPFSKGSKSCITLRPWQKETKTLFEWVLSGLYAPSCGLHLSEVIFLTRIIYPLLTAFLHNPPYLPIKYSLQNISIGWQTLPLLVPRGVLCTTVSWRQVTFGW